MTEAVEPTSKTLLIQAFEQVTDDLAGTGPAARPRPVITIEDEHDDGPGFFAHQVLHADGVICVEISQWAVDGERGWTVVHQQCDPGLVFDEVVRR